jgi:hypothetical protein
MTKVEALLTMKETVAEAEMAVAIEGTRQR